MKLQKIEDVVMGIAIIAYLVSHFISSMMLRTVAEIFIYVYLFRTYKEKLVSYREEEEKSWELKLEMAGILLMGISLFILLVADVGQLLFGWK